MRFLLAFLFLISPILAAEFPDGAWNGKFWDREKLIAGAENGDADAMAEWAFCSEGTLLKIAYPIFNSELLEIARKSLFLPIFPNQSYME